MSNIGESLNKKRTELGLSLEVVEEETRIRKKYLEAMENGQWHVMPGNVYARGFLKTYAVYLGINEKEMLQELSRIQSPEEITKPPVIKIELPEKPRRKIGIMIGSFAIILLLCVQVLYSHYLNPKDLSAQKRPETVQQPPAVPDNTSAPEKEPALVENPPANPEQVNPIVQVKDITLGIKIKNSKCWVQVKEGTNPLFEKIMSQGEEKIFSGLSNVSFTLGNAGVAQISLNNNDLGSLGAVGEVIKKAYVLENNEIKETF